MSWMRFKAEGFKAYFPNLTFMLIRSLKKRPPNHFTFRVPRFLNKYEIYQYMKGLYNLEIEDIRTTNFISRRNIFGKKYGQKKTAVVILKERLDAEGRAIPFWKIPEPRPLRPDEIDPAYLQRPLYPKNTQ